ncbi:MAG: helix-turn-helix domain-containing protein [Methylococcaceae bacterium]|nr:helix-turn-helix domain-containing protein [Methylococcaceae bacterium]MCI0733074.1 helix-turn-helix domain-containing protein [Methylococcaceae bacterium]
MQSNPVVRSITNRFVKPVSDQLGSPELYSKPCDACFQKSNCLARSLELDDFRRYSRAVSQSKRMAKGHYLYRLSDPFEALFMILSGSVKSCRLDEEGNELIVGFHIPGDLLALDAIGGRSYPSSAIVLEDCFVCKIPYRLFDERFSDSPRLHSELIRQAAQALRSEHLHSVFLRKNPADERLALFLADLSRRLESRNYACDRFDLSLSRRDIGNYLGLALETVSRSFSRLQDAGLITVRHRHIVIHDRQHLEILGRGCAESGPNVRRVQCNG